MDNENSQLNTLENSSDDEIFEIISNPSEYEYTQIYGTAISIALKRELISEYQAENLLDGNTTVLNYNPNIIDYQVEDFVNEKEIQKEEIEKSKISNLSYGLMLIGGGVLLMLFVYSEELYFPFKTLVVGIISIVVGISLVIIGLIEIEQKKKEKLKQ